MWLSEIYRCFRFVFVQTKNMADQFSLAFPDWRICFSDVYHSFQQIRVSSHLIFHSYFSFLWLFQIKGYALVTSTTPSNRYAFPLLPTYTRFLANSYFIIISILCTSPRVNSFNGYAFSARFENCLPLVLLQFSKWKGENIR